MAGSAQRSSAQPGDVPGAELASPCAERYGRALSVVLWATIGGCFFLILTFGYGRDQGIYAVVARTVLEGGMPYRDAWDFKPPGIYLPYILARVVFGSAQWGIRVVEVAGLAGMAWAMMALARRWWGQIRLGLFAAALAILVHTQLDFWHTAQPESFGGMLTVWGLYVGTRPATPRLRLLQYVLSGVLFGLAGLLKPPLAGAGVVFALAVAIPLLTGRRAGPEDTGPAQGQPRGLGVRVRRALVPIAMVLLGGLIPFAGCLAWFASAGALSALYETFFVFTPHYTALGYHSGTVVQLFYHAFAQWLFSYSSLLCVGLLGWLAAGPGLWRQQGVGLVLGVVAVQLFGVALQGKFFPYHYAASWPLAALVAALGWWHWWQRAVHRGPRALVLFVVVLGLVASLRTATKDVSSSFWWRTGQRVSLFLFGSGTQADIDELASVADVHGPSNRQVAELLRRCTPPDRPIYIWGFEPVIYDLAHRPLASRYLYNVPQRVEWAAERTQPELMDELRANPPTAVVVVHNDIFPMVTGDMVDSAQALWRFPALQQLIDEHYQLLATVQDLDVHVLPAAATCSTAR